MGLVGLVRRVGQVGSCLGGCCACAVAVAMTAGLIAQPATSKTYKGLEVSVTTVARATNVSLTDCPPGANSVRGVIKPGDANEFASITIDFKVTPAFKPATVPKPVLHDVAGKTYNTAQSFGEIGSTPAFTCTFSFRVPKGTNLKHLMVDTLLLDLTSK